MPELPEVETVRRGLEASIIGQTITGVELGYSRLLRGISPDDFIRRLTGAEILAVGRRAKMLLIRVSAAELVVHLKMSGRLFLADPNDAVEKHTHIILSLSGGRQLRYMDTRKFGFWRWVDPGDRDGAPELSGLGPEPLELSEDAFFRLMGSKEKSVRPIKLILMDQSFIAGIGNIYADEILFAAGLLPTRTAASLSNADKANLFKEMKRVLREAIANRGTTFSQYVDSAGGAGGHQDELKVFRRTGEACYRCGGEIRRKKLGGRGTHYCPDCQK